MQDMEMFDKELLDGDMDLEDATGQVNEDDNDEDEDQAPDMDLQDDRESSDQDSDVEDDEDQELRMNAVKTPQVIHACLQSIPLYGKTLLQNNSLTGYFYFYSVL